MAHLIAQAVFQGASGLPEERFINVWHFQAGGGTSGYAQFAADRLVAFYTNGLTSYYSAMVSTAADAHQIRVYDAADPEPRTPLLVEEFTAAGSGNALPAEVALCMSFQGVSISGQPQARRRGRVYLGPFNDNALAAGADARPNSALVGEILDAAEALLIANDGNATWVVYSPTDDAMVLVDNGWVDNAFDTQRRRGERPTTRSIFPAP